MKRTSRDRQVPRYQETFSLRVKDAEVNQARAAVTDAAVLEGLSLTDMTPVSGRRKVQLRITEVGSAAQINALRMRLAKESRLWVMLEYGPAGSTSISGSITAAIFRFTFSAARRAWWGLARRRRGALVERSGRDDPDGMRS